MRGMKFGVVAATLMATLLMGPATHAVPLEVPVISITASAGVFK